MWVYISIKTHTHTQLQTYMYIHTPTRSKPMLVYYVTIIRTSPCPVDMHVFATTLLLYEELTTPTLIDAYCQIMINS